MYYLSDSEFKHQDEKNNYGNHKFSNDNNQLDEKIKKTMDERDHKIKQIEENINHQLNAIENYQQYQQFQQQEYQNKQLKEADLKGLRQQVFVNPRQTKLRKNIEMLMGELKKIKAIDPDLKIFNSIYKKRQSTYEIKGQSRNQLNSKGKTDLNEIDILMEILSAADLKNINEQEFDDQQEIMAQDDIISDHQTIRIEENPISDRALTHQEQKRQIMPLINNLDPLSRIQTANNQQQDQLNQDNQKQFSLKRASISQPSLLGFGKNKFSQNQLQDIHEKVQLSPIKLDRITQIDKVLKRTTSTQMKFDFQQGQSLIGGKDYQGRVRNIFLEQRRKLETQVQNIDQEIQLMDQTKRKAKNFDYYSIKDIMSDQWVQQLTNQKQRKRPDMMHNHIQNTQQPMIKEANNEDSSLKSLKSKSHRHTQDKLSIGESNKDQVYLPESSNKNSNALDIQAKRKLNKNQTQLLLKPIDSINLDEKFQSQRRPIQILNIENLKKDISLFNKEIQDFNKTIFKNHMHNSNVSTQIGGIGGQYQSQENHQSSGTPVGGLNLNQVNMTTFDNQSYSKINVMSPQQEALDRKLESLKPLKKIRKVIQYTTKGVEL